MKITEKIRTVIGWSLIGALATFIAFNPDKIEVNFIFAQVKMPIAFVVLFSAAAGAGSILAFQFLKKRKPPTS